MKMILVLYVWLIRLRYSCMIFMFDMCNECNNKLDDDLFGNLLKSTIVIMIV